jgi:hypothetical protein
MDWRVVTVYRADSASGGKVWASDFGRTYWGKEDSFFNNKRFQNSKEIGSNDTSLDLAFKKERSGYREACFAIINEDGAMREHSRDRHNLLRKLENEASGSSSPTPQKSIPKTVEPGVFVIMDVAKVAQVKAQAYESIIKCVAYLPDNIEGEFSHGLPSVEGRAVTVHNFFTLALLAEASRLLDKSNLQPYVSLSFTDASGKSVMIDVNKASNNQESLWQHFNSNFDELLPFFEATGWQPVSFQRAVEARVALETSEEELSLLDVF